MVNHARHLKKSKEKYIEHTGYYGYNACFKKDAKVLLLQIFIY